MSRPGSTKTAGKAEDSKLNKLKQFLGIGGGKTHSNVMVGSVRPQCREYIFTPELLKEISSSSPANHRRKTILDLCETVQTKRLEDNAVEVLWHHLQDLLHPQVEAEARQLALHFLACLIKGQYDRLGITRAHFFRVIKAHTLFEDLPHRLEVFRALSDDGRDLEYFEEEAGPFLLHWMRDIISSSKMSVFLSLLVNVVKYNAAHLDDDIIAGLVLNTCVISTRTGLEADIELCLQVLDAVVCYSYLPAEALQHFVICMCRIVNVERFCQSSWQLMRKLLGTHLGHSAIYTMCCILQDRSNITDTGAMLLRGAVFFIGMALWGSKKVTYLKHPPSSVLPSFLQALHHSNHTIVAYEIVLSVQRLVYKYGPDQQMVTWDNILDLIESLLKHTESQAQENPHLVSNIHELLTSIEQLHEKCQFNGSADRLFSIIECCATRRPEASILALISYKADQVHPVQESWIARLNHLMDKYFRSEVRTCIRVKMLEVLSSVLSANRHLYEDELMEMVVLPHLGHIELDPDVEVRKASVELLVDLAQTCLTSKCFDILELLKKVISRPWCVSTPSSPVTDEPVGTHRPLTQNLPDVTMAALGLLSIFKMKLLQLPVSHALQAYELLVDYLHAHYCQEHKMPGDTTIKLAIFECFLQLRADSLHRLGLPDRSRDHKMCFSPYALCTYRGEPERLSGNVSPTVQVSTSPVPSTSHGRTIVFPYCRAFKCVRLCLEYESDWEVLRLVLEQLPCLLQNKTLVLSADHEDIDRFCSRLCIMVSDRNLGLPERLQNAPARFTKSDFHAHLFPVLTCLASYHQHLDRGRQRELVRCLEFGLVSKCARICVQALTVCTLEMQEVMMRQLPAVLLKLSQISATISMAIPLMEFLSSLIHLPQLYTNFVEDQYMSIFAIALPYTNPFKYSHYTVSLAYHVIAMWFLKCRQPFRKGFVGFIVKGLKSNVLRQFEETAQMRARQNQDSSDRSRTGSLNDETIQKKRAAALARARQARSGADNSAAAALEEESMSLFHRELTETCVDMMARYTFSSCSTMPKRSPVAEFLLSDGQSQCWMLGNKIISITTSGGSAPATSTSAKPKAQFERDGMFKGAFGQSQSQMVMSGRRRHRSAAVKSISETIILNPHSKDDLLIHRISSSEDRSDAEKSPKSGTISPQEEVPGAYPRKSASLDSPRTDMPHASDLAAGSQQRASEKGSTHNPDVCKQWCTAWAEVHIRRPTGNVSWMMRIQNKQEPAMEVVPDISLADISNLFRTSETSYEDIDAKKIESGSLEETEYESLHEEHFHFNLHGSREMLAVKAGSLDSLHGSRETLMVKQSQQDSPHGSRETLLVKQGHHDSPHGSREMLSVKQGHQDSPHGSRETLLVKQGHQDSPHGSRETLLVKQGHQDSLHGSKEMLSIKQGHQDSPHGSREALFAHHSYQERLHSSHEMLTTKQGSLDNLHASKGSPTKQGSLDSLHASKEMLPPKQVSLDSSLRGSKDVPVSGLAKQAVQSVHGSKETAGSSQMSSGHQRTQVEEPSAETELTEEELMKMLKKSNSSPDLTPSLQAQLEQGSGQAHLQEVYKRAIELQNATSVASTEQASSVPPVRPELQKRITETDMGSLWSGNLDGHLVKGEKTLSQDRLPGPGSKDPSPVVIRPRGHTISTMSTTSAPVVPAEKHVASAGQSPETRRQDASSESMRSTPSKAAFVGSKETSGVGGISPSFVFLQLYHGNMFGAGDDRPLMLPEKNEIIKRAVKMLDLMYPHETHKLGVLYVGKDQANNETAILSNVYGSPRYVQFLQGLGTLLRLKDCDPECTYMGGLETDGSDGQFAYSWTDDFMQVIFHVATLMPNRDSDPNCNAKKRHIGNDFVSIVYNDSNKPYKIGTIKGQFNYVNVLITPLDNSSNAVTVQTRDALVSPYIHSRRATMGPQTQVRHRVFNSWDIMDIIGHTDTKIISDIHLPMLVRQMALHANLASLILQRQKTNPKDPYASNWLERLRQIKRIRTKVVQETNKNEDSRRGSPIVEDFTDFV